MPTTPASASSKSTSIRPPTIRDMCPAPPAGTGPPSSATRWCATSSRSKKLEELLGKSGIDNKTTIVLYGDNNNWFAAWAFWQLKIYGHEDVRIMDGGRKKWLAEGTRAEHRQADVRREDLQGERAGPLAARVPAGSAAGGRPARRRRSSTCAARRSSPARSSRRPGCRRPASAAATFPARRAFRGARTATTTARSRASTS